MIQRERPAPPSPGGTTFEAFPPASMKGTSKEAELDLETATGVQTILLVDDQSLILEVEESMLRELGYRVLPAGSGMEALERFREQRSSIDLVILDVIMPGLSGGETLARLREIDPDVKVVLSSGYSLEDRTEEVLEDGRVGFLLKPFSLEALSRKVKEFLDRQSPGPVESAGTPPPPELLQQATPVEPIGRQEMGERQDQDGIE